MDAKSYQKKANKLQDDMLNYIVGLMDMNDVKLISFVNNGDYSDFDVDRSFAFVDVNSTPIEKEIIAVYLENGNLFILCEDELGAEYYNILEETIVFKDSITANELFENLPFITLDETFAPLDTVLQLMWSVEETLQCVEA